MVKALFCIVIAGIACASAFAQPPSGDGSRFGILLPGENFAPWLIPLPGDIWWVLFQAAGEQVRLRYAPLNVTSRMLPDTSFVTEVHAEGFEDDEVIVFFRGTKDLPRGPVSTVFSGALPLVPGLNVALGPEGGGQRALEVAAIKEGDAPLKGLNILLRSTDGTSQLLYTAMPGHLGAVPHLRWAGDLDKDHQLDLFFENPVGGHPTNAMLFLSSYAEAGEFVRDATRQMKR